MSESVLCGVHREEKTEQLMDSKHEAERLEQELQRFKQEVSIFPFLALMLGPLRPGMHHVHDVMDALQTMQLKMMK